MGAMEIGNGSVFRSSWDQLIVLEYQYFKDTVAIIVIGVI
jgi:hypothetical protein